MAIRAAHRNPIRSVARGTILRLGKIKRFIINLLTATSTRNSPTTGWVNSVLTTFLANTPSFNEGDLQNYPAGTNLLLWSEDLTDTVWTKFQASISADSTIAPDGLSTADKIVEAATTNVHVVFQSHTSAGDTCFSAFVKAEERTWAVMRGDIAETWFDVANGVVGTVGAGVTASIKDVGNGWFLCKAWINIAAPVVVQIGPATTDGVSSYLGDITKGLYVWGTQIINGQIPTPYIPTTTTAVTRSADVTTVPTPSFVQQDEDWAFKFRGTPHQTAQVLKALFSFDSDATNYTEIQLNAANITANSVLLGVSNGAAVGIYSHTVDVQFETNVYYVAATKTLGIRSDDVSGNISAVAFVEDVLTSHPVVTATLSIGNRNSANQAVCDFDNDGVPVFYKNKEATGW